MQVVGIRKVTDPSGSLHRCCMAVVSSCRSDVRLSPLTSATLAMCYMCHMGLLVLSRRKVGMTSSQHDLYILGYTHATMASTMGS